MKTLEQELRSTTRAIVIYHKKRGWGVTTKEGASWGEIAWKSSFQEAWKTCFNRDIELSEQEAVSLTRIEKKGPFKASVDGKFSAHEWWPASQYSINGWLRGGLL